MTTSEGILSLRKRLGWTRRRLSRESKVPERSLVRAEKEGKEPTVIALSKLAETASKFHLELHDNGRLATFFEKRHKAALEARVAKSNPGSAGAVLVDDLKILLGCINALKVCVPVLDLSDQELKERDYLSRKEIVDRLLNMLQLMHSRAFPYIAKDPKAEYYAKPHPENSLVLVSRLPQTHLTRAIVQEAAQPRHA